METGTLDEFNNDHLISPDGGTVYASSDDGHIYAIPIGGGAPRRVECRYTSNHHCYLHGISPDGRTLLYVGLEQAHGPVRTNLFAVPTEGGASRQLTDLAPPHDGPEVDLLQLGKGFARSIAVLPDGGGGRTSRAADP